MVVEIKFKNHEFKKYTKAVQRKRADYLQSEVKE